VNESERLRHFKQRHCRAHSFYTHPETFNTVIHHMNVRETAFQRQPVKDVQKAQNERLAGIVPLPPDAHVLGVATSRAVLQLGQTRNGLFGAGELRKLTEILSIVEPVCARHDVDSVGTIECSFNLPVACRFQFIEHAGQFGDTIGCVKVVRGQGNDDTGHELSRVVQVRRQSNLNRGFASLEFGWSPEV
jgi:hypothetical protein